MSNHRKPDIFYICLSGRSSQQEESDFNEAMKEAKKLAIESNGLWTVFKAVGHYDANSDGAVVYSKIYNENEIQRLRRKMESAIGQISSINTEASGLVQRMVELAEEMKRIEGR